MQKKKVKKFISVILVIFIITMTLAGCSNSVNSNNTTNNVEYSDYTFWEKDNVVRIVLPISKIEQEQDDVFNEIGELELSSKYLERVEILKTAMISYFSEIYNIDISEKLAKQKLRAFEATTDSDGSMTMGYVVTSEPDVLNLNRALFTEYKDYFDNTYIHESLHQIGFAANDSGMITEGIVDAITDLILRKANIKSYPTDNYYEARILGYQILAADKGIAEFYLENSDSNIVSRISEKLKDVEKPLENIDPGERLEDLIDGLTYGSSGTVDIWHVAFEAQEIVRSYCQSFNPDTETIDYIRSYYLVEDYENIDIVKEGEGYRFFG